MLSLRSRTGPGASFCDYTADQSHTPHAVMEAALAQTIRSKVEARLRAQDPALLVLDEEPDHGFPAAPGLAHRDQAAVGRGLVGIGPDVVALRRQAG